MKKLLFIFCVLLITISGNSQSIVNRAGSANTVQDARLSAQYNLFIPRYADTASVNNFQSIGIDSCSAVIFTYDINAFWVRACNPKRWVSWQNQTVLPDGVYSGGDVAYSGTNLDFIVSPAVFVLGGTIYRTPQTTVTLDAADPANDRLDLIVLSSNNNGEATKITGTPSATPQEPSFNPLTTIRRALVSVPAGSLVPGNVSQSIIYDENTGEPSEWTPSTNGVVDFGDTDYPYHLTVDAEATGLTTSQNISFVNDDTVHSASYGSLVFFVRLSGSIPANSLSVGLYYQGALVSNILSASTFGINRTIINGYQSGIIPLVNFAQRDIVFDEVRFVTFSNISATFRLDYIQLQTGFTPYFSQPNSITSITTSSGAAVATQPSDNVNILGANGITTSAVGKTVTIDASGLIRNDIPFNSPQPTSGVSVDRYLRVTRPSPTANNILDIRGYRGGTSLAQFIDSNSSGNGPFQGYSIHPIARFLAPNMVDGHASSIYLGRNFDTYGAVKLEFFQKQVALADSGVFLGIGFFGAAAGANSPFAFWPDSTLVIGNYDIKHSRFKLDVPFGMSRFNGAEIRNYTQQGGLLTDSGYVWKAYLDSVLTSGVTGTVTNIAFNTATGIRGSSEPITTTGTLRIDTTTIATRAWVNSVAGGGGFTGVTSVGVTDANGFDFTITNPTTTPVISATTTVTNAQLMYSNSGAITGSSNLTWTNATNRLGVGATGAAYLSLAASTTSQASLNIGNGGTAPTSPQNGDVWVAGNHILARLGGVTYQIDQQTAAAVTSITGTADQVIASASTGAITLSLPQSIATTSVVQFGRATLGGTAATSPLTFTSNTDATGAAGRWYYNGTRLGFSPSTTIKRVALTNDVAPANGQIPIGNGTDYTVSAISPSNNTMVITNGSGSIVVGLNMTPQTLTDGATITFNGANGFNATVTLGGTGRTLARSNWVAGATYTLVIRQDGTGSRTITTWPSGILWQNGTAPTLPTTPNSIFIVTFYFNGTNCFGNYSTGSYQ